MLSSHWIHQSDASIHGHEQSQSAPELAGNLEGKLAAEGMFVDDDLLINAGMDLIDFVGEDSMNVFLEYLFIVEALELVAVLENGLVALRLEYTDCLVEEFSDSVGEDVVGDLENAFGDVGEGLLVEKQTEQADLQIIHIRGEDSLNGTA